MSSSHFPTIILILTFLSSLHSIDATESTPCSDISEEYSVAFPVEANISQCKRLGTLGAAFGWNYHTNTQNMTNKTVDIFFGVKLSFSHGWVAWGVNPVGPQMVGTRALIAILKRNGSVLIDKYNVTEDTKRGCRFQPSPVEVLYLRIRSNYLQQNGLFTMFVTVNLTSDYNVSSLNHVWQVGSRLDGIEPKVHDTTIQNFDSYEVLNLTSGVSRKVGHQLWKVREVHGILNIIGWGTLLPTGIIAARYFHEFPYKKERWFRFHMTCQLVAFVIGTIGWTLGISLGAVSKNYTFKTHRIIGITIFSLATLQMLALYLRPKRNDDYRKYWHIYHHFIGYSLFSLIVVNIFQGIKILRPMYKWKWAYVGILCGLGLIVIVLEVITWCKYFQANINKPNPQNQSIQSTQSNQQAPTKTPSGSGPPS